MIKNHIHFFKTNWAIIKPNSTNAIIKSEAININQERVIFITKLELTP